LDKIDPSTKVLIKNLLPLSDSYSDSTGFPGHKKTQTKNKLSKLKSQFKKGSFSVEEKQKINDTLCEYALSKDLSKEQIISYLKLNNIEKKSSIINLDEDDKDSLLYHLSVAVPSRNIKSIIKYIIHKYCHSDDIDNKRPIYTSLKLKEDKISSSDFTSYVSEDKKSPLIIQMTLLQAIQYFLDNFCENSIKGYKLLKYNFEFVPKNDLNDEEYKLDLEEGKISISEELKESKEHRTNIFFIKSSFDLGTLFKIHYDKVEINWEKVKKIYDEKTLEEDKDLYELSEKEIENEWKKILKEYKVEEICSIRQDKKMIKEIIEYGPETFEDINWEIINNGKSIEENKEILRNYMRENDIFGVKPFNELLEIIKEEINISLEKILGKQYDEYSKFDKDTQRRKESDFDNVYKAYINKKRKLSDTSTI
jgi:hypothetical protein